MDLKGRHGPVDRWRVSRLVHGQQAEPHTPGASYRTITPGVFSSGWRHLACHTAALPAARYYPAGRI